MNVNNLLPNFSLFQVFLEKPIALVVVAPIAIVSKSVHFYDAITMLVALFIADFFTGLLASYFEWKKMEIKKDKYFFGKGEGFSSDKFKKMFVKGMVYLGFPMFLIKFQQIFQLRTFSFKSISDAQLDLVTIIILIFCGNELFSIFRENLPKCGLDIVAGIKKMIGLYKEIKNDTSE